MFKIQINVTKRIEWLKKRMPIQPYHEEYLRLQMTELAYEVEEKVVDALQPTNSTECVKSSVVPMLHKIAACIDEAIENTEKDNEDKWEEIQTAIELLNGIADDYSMFVRY